MYPDETPVSVVIVRPVSHRQGGNMSLRIRMDINGDDIDNICITNRGPLDGLYEEGDGPGGDGVRLYSFTSERVCGYVEHRRGDGAHALAWRVLMDIANQPVEAP